MIQPKELMLGNWVCLNGDAKYPVRVEAVYTDYVFLQPNAEGFEIFSAREDEICPIPLTEEVLLKNGFIKSVYVEDMCFSFDIPTDDEFSLLKFVDKGFFVYMLGKLYEIKYLHQLQNILTIAGIEFDFKI